MNSRRVFVAQNGSYHNSGISRIDGILRERAFFSPDRVVQKSGAFCHHVAMRKTLVYVPIALSLVVLGAHFMRYGNTIAVLGLAGLIALLMVRQPWVARLMQVVLILGALEWVRTLYELAQVRAALGQPYTRMVVILGVVAAVTFCSALLFQSPTLKGIYLHRNTKQ